MKNRFKISGIIALTAVIALVFGMTVVGCDNGSTDKGNDTWSNVTSLDQLSGTWKGSYRQTKTMQEFYGMTNAEWAETGMSQIFGNDMKITTTMEITQTISASAKTVSGSLKMTMAFSGSKISTAWAMIKEQMGDDSGFTVNDTNHSMTMTNNINETLSDDDIAEILAPSGIQINQSGTKIRSPASDNSPEIIFAKQ